MVFCRAQADWRSAAWLVRLVLSAGACYHYYYYCYYYHCYGQSWLPCSFVFLLPGAALGWQGWGAPAAPLRARCDLSCVRTNRSLVGELTAPLAAWSPGSNRPRAQEVHCQLPLSPASPPAAFHPSYSSRLLTSSGQDQLNGLGRRTPVDKLPRERQFEYAAAANAGPAGFVRAQVSIHQKS